MKIITIASISLAILVIAITILVSLTGPREYSPAEDPPLYKEKEEAPPPSFEELMPHGARADSDVIVRVLLGGEIVEMSMELYLIGVVSAEMPASFEPDALKAQAIAARTDVLHKMYVSPKAQHPDAHTCGYFTCCVAFNSDARLREKWGGNYVYNITRIINAVTETDGVFMSYGGAPILAVFHASSAGRTETSGNVWVADRPYLQSVYSPETEYLVPGFISTVTVSQSDFIETVRANLPNARLDDDASLWITDIAHTESGRVSTLKLGGVTIRGTELRAMFSLRSTAVTIDIIDGDIIFTTAGNGHGVGMSQHGANIMARNGMSYREILRAYYTGIEFVAPEQEIA